MRNSGIIGGKTLLALAAAGALISSASFAAPAAQNQTLSLGNSSTGCVRFFVEGTRDVGVNSEIYTNYFQFGKRYMVSAFKGKCSGAALKNFWFTPKHQNGNILVFDLTPTGLQPQASR